MFPHGGPGAALFLLRVSVATILMVGVANRFGVLSLVFAAGVVVSIFLILGFLTPIVSVIACVFAVANLLIGPHTESLVFVATALDPAALALLGPGAYSLDARFYGRSVTVVPPRKDSRDL